jgi:hypothetical protein
MISRIATTSKIVHMLIVPAAQLNRHTKKDQTVSMAFDRGVRSLPWYGGVEATHEIFF